MTKLYLDNGVEQMSLNTNNKFRVINKYETVKKGKHFKEKL